MTILFPIGVFEALFLILLIAGKKKKSLPDLFLAIIFFLYALTLAGPWMEIYNYRNGYPYPVFLNISWLFLLLHGPALWFYIQSLTQPKFTFRTVYLLHILPFLFFSWIQLDTFILLPATEKIHIVQNEIFKEFTSYRLSLIAIGLSTLSYNIWALLLIRRYRLRIMQEYSRIEVIDLGWLQVLTIAAVVVYSVNVLLFNLDDIMHFASYEQLMLLAYSFATVYVLFLGYFGLQQGNIFISTSPLKNRSISKVKEVRASASKVKSGDSDFIEKLICYMEQNQPYLDPEITLRSLSEKLKVRPEYLSEILNSSLDQNFFDFINKYRVEEFKIMRLRKDKKHLSIVGLACECGFNSKAAFYRAFKKFESLSPSDYMMKVSE